MCDSAESQKSTSYVQAVSLPSLHAQFAHQLCTQARLRILKTRTIKAASLPDHYSPHHPAEEAAFF